jgi:hypothetical protein
MMTTIRVTLAALGLATLLPGGAALAAREPTLSDIAACNEDATSRTSASAFPRPGGRMEAGAPIKEGERALPGRARGSEKSDPTGSIVTETPDPLVKGMDAQKADDPAYRVAYRACMQERLAR